jgi:hypothetical protein
MIHERGVLEVLHGIAFHRKTASPGTQQGGNVGGGNRDNSGDGSEVLTKPAYQFDCRGCLWIARTMHRHFERDQVLGTVTRVQTMEPQKCLDHQSRRHQQQHRHGHFDNHQCRPQPPLRAGGCLRTPAFFQSIRKLCPGRGDGGNHTREKSRARCYC